MSTPSTSCPCCAATSRHRKIGCKRTGSQRFQCQHCHKIYRPCPKPQGCDPRLKQQAVRLSADGLSLRRIARTLGVNHQSVANWLKVLALPDPARPAAADSFAPHLLTLTQMKCRGASERIGSSALTTGSQTTGLRLTTTSFLSYALSGPTWAYERRRAQDTTPMPTRQASLAARPAGGLIAVSGS